MGYVLFSFQDAYENAAVVYVCGKWNFYEV